MLAAAVLGGKFWDNRAHLLHSLVPPWFHSSATIEMLQCSRHDGKDLKYNVTNTIHNHSEIQLYATAMCNQDSKLNTCDPFN